MLVAITVSFALGACGASSSETPWPVEPIDTEPSPAGEHQPKGNVLDVGDLPNAYSGKDAGVDASASQ